MYEYECRHCGRRFERIEKFSDDTHTECECGQQAERLLSAPAIQFKGTGWYVTDYAKKGSTTESKKSDGGSTSSGSDKGSESKTESKPAASKPSPKP